ncbi:MAG: caspase family protein [Cyanobacteria bacterium Co-bin8]|nr:caspase family protein [Cyanobacteria bacterium Co-bin8]
MSRDALVVGVNAYQKLPSLNAPAQDAEAIARCLESLGEFRVYRMPEMIQGGKPAIAKSAGITTRMLEESLIRLFKPTGKNVPQTAVFYYSGHGLQRNVGIREGYLATSDADPNSGNFGVSLFWLRRLLQESPVRQRILWLDCCHSGELLNFLEADPGANDGTDRLFMAASREYEPAYEALEGSHSVFTKALLSGLNPYKSRGGIVNGHHLTEVVSSELKGEIQQPLFESSGSDIVLTRASGTPAAVPAAATTTLDRLKHLSYSFCPFRGLNPFEEAHAGHFFGREKITSQLARYVERSSFCAVVGASGIGKTSLLKAGLIPQLRQSQSASGEVVWDIRQITPDLNPLQSLAEAFIEPNAEGIERADQLRRAESFLQAGGPGLAQLVRATLNDSQTNHPSKRLLLVIDQFERVLPAQVSRTEADPEKNSAARSQFIHCLSEVLKDGSLPLHIVIALRSDQIESLRPYPDFYARVTEHYLTVSPMAYEQVKAAVVKPLEKVGLRYDPNLIYTLMLDVVSAPGELPLLQLALQELWRRREKDPSGQAAPKLTLEAYAELGGVRNLLNQRATQFFESLTEAEQKVAQRIFLSLCELGEGTEDSRRRACLSELMTTAFSDVLVVQTLSKLVEAHLVVVNHETIPPSSNLDGVALPEATWTTPKFLKQDSSRVIASLLKRTQAPVAETSRPVPTLDIVHESLIRSWPLLRQWLEENRHIIWLQRRLEAAATEWQQHGYPTHPEYLLTGSRLRDADEFQKTQGHWLSSLAQQYLVTSQREDRKRQWKRHAMQCLIPASVVLGMLSAYGQYRVGEYLTNSAADTQAKAALQAQASDGAAPLVKSSALGSLPGFAGSNQTGSGEIAKALADSASTPTPKALRSFLTDLRVAPTALLAAVQTQIAQRSAMAATAAPGFALALPYMAASIPANSSALPGGTALPQSMSQPVIVVWCTQTETAPVCTTTVPQ